MKKYLNFDKLDEKICLNYFLEDYKVNIKIPLEESDDKMEIDNFKLINSIYLTEF